MKEEDRDTVIFGSILVFGLIAIIGLAVAIVSRYGSHP
jgi:hypothetical protein